MTSKQDTKILELASKNTDITAIDIHWKMKKWKVNISVRTIQKRLSEGGGKYMTKLSKPLLTKKHQENQLK